MKFKVKQNELVKALNIVSKGVTSRTTIPILKGILLKVENEKVLRLEASDLEISIEKLLEIKEGEVGEIVVQAKLFIDIIRKLPNEEITFTLEDTNLNISCSNTSFNIIGNKADEFPNILVDTNSEEIIFNKEILKDMIDKTSFSASIDESRGVITGCLIEIKEDSLKLVSLDGFRMAITKENISNRENKNIIISAKILNEVSKIILEENEDSDIVLKYNDKKAIFIINDTKVIVSLLDGTFVKYEDILPKDESTKVVLNKGDFLEAIERASLLAKVGKNNLIKIEIKDNFLTISSKSEEGNVKEQVYISKEGNDLNIGFNSKYLLDALKVINEDEIKLIFNSPVSPCLIKPIDSDSYIYLILPVRISL